LKIQSAHERTKKTRKWDEFKQEYNFNPDQTKAKFQ
jgi:hypothetical protein